MREVFVAPAAPAPAAPPSEPSTMAIWCGAVAPHGLQKGGKPKKKGPRRGKSQVERAVEETQRMQASGSWSGAAPRHLVGLYVLCHRHVYGIDPEELERDWPHAVLAAKRLVEKEFSGELARVVAFLRWTWTRERGAEKKRDASSGFRIGWRFQFVAKGLLTDYRLALARQGRGGAPAVGASSPG